MPFAPFFNIGLAVFLLSTFLSLAGILSRRKILRTIATVLLFAGTASLTAGFILLGLAAGRIPFANTYETLMLFTWLSSVFFLFLIPRDGQGYLRLLFAFLLSLALAASSLIDAHPQPLVPALKSNWLFFHVLLCFVAYAAFFISFIAGLLFLIGGEKIRMDLDKLSYKNILFGFPFLTAGIISGSIWAKQAWGTYWNWDPKETWSLVLWLIYLIYLHLRTGRGWKGKGPAWISVLGFAAVLFTYFGVNYLLPSLHSYR
jgi:ABC-type transport system involved in cytochrome c biogenesis permease subunit